jgi:hypothetical protein
LIPNKETLTHTTKGVPHQFTLPAQQAGISSVTDITDEIQP